MNANRLIALQRPAQLSPICLIATGLTLLAGAALQIAAYWPGIMIWDAIRQYDQALSGDFDDWHPPAFEWLWQKLIPLASGPGPMLAIQMLLYWGGFALFAAWALQNRRVWLAFAITACAFMPLSFAMLGAVLKDSLMAASLLCVTALLAWSPQATLHGLRWIAAALLLGAMTVRFNGFLAGLPLMVALLPQQWRQTPWRLALTSSLAVIPLGLAVPVANRLLDADRSGVELSLIIYDLAGITHFSGVDVFPALPVANKVAVNADCYSPVKWDRYAWWGEAPCAIGFDTIRAAFKASGQSPTLFWLQAIAAHPLAYTRHRFGHFNSNVRFLVRGDVERPVPEKTDPNPWHFQIEANTAHEYIDSLALASAQTPLGWPVFWLGLAVGVLMISRTLPSRRVVIPLALSTLLYGSGYLMVSVASDLRYHLWTMVGTLVAAVIAAGDVLNGQRPRFRLIIIMISPALVLALAGWAWRMA